MISKQTKIMLTGSKGQLAQALLQSPFAHEFHIIAYSRNELDITNEEAVARALAATQPDFLINTAAYTAVDLAEREQEQANAVNTLAAGILAKHCKAAHVKLLHLSTDYIFDEKTPHPINEDTPAKPINHYGKSKWLGEEAIRADGDQYLILRVSGVFSEFGKNFLKTILKLAQEKKELSIVNDQIICPTYAIDIADTIYRIIQKHPHYPMNHTYHYCNKDPVSWYDFARVIIETAKSIQPVSVENLKAIASSQFKCEAIRPLYSVLDCSKINQDFSIQQTHWHIGVNKAIKALLTNNARTSS